jgi:hypothetical protein
MITSFDGDNRFLSNFWPCLVHLDGMSFHYVENAFVAAKTTLYSERLAIQNMTPCKAKAFGRRLKLREGWNDMRLEVMEALVTEKFQEVCLAGMLRATGDQQLIEGNTWNDTFWGMCDGKGENHLGRILMRVRDNLGPEFT